MDKNFQLLKMGFQSKYTGDQVEIGLDKIYSMDNILSEIVKDTSDKIETTEKEIIQNVDNMITKALEDLANLDPWIEL